VIASLVRRVVLADETVTITIGRDALTAYLLDRQVESASSETPDDPISIEIPVKFQRRGVEAKLIVPEPQDASSQPDPALVRLLVRAHDWFGRIRRGEVQGIQEIAGAESVDRSYVTRVVSLVFLSPKIVKAIHGGRQPAELTAKRLLRSAARLTLGWVEQEIAVCHSEPDNRR
jgi:site-specific DNA recombinase